VCPAFHSVTHGCAFSCVCASVCFCQLHEFPCCCRFEKRVYIPLPEATARGKMFKIHLGDTPNALTPDDFDTLGERTEGCARGGRVGPCVGHAATVVIGFLVPTSASWCARP
jgi:hypothetical protein